MATGANAIMWSSSAATTKSTTDRRKPSTARRVASRPSLSWSGRICRLPRQSRRHTSTRNGKYERIYPEEACRGPRGGGQLEERHGIVTFPFLPSVTGAGLWSSWELTMNKIGAPRLPCTLTGDESAMNRTAASPAMPIRGLEWRLGRPWCWQSRRWAGYWRS
jgi:hypothetical protein